jgi:hypothetical protein
MILEEAKIWEHVEKKIVAPTNPTKLATHTKEEFEPKSIILDSMKDHFIPHIADKSIGKLTYEALVGLFQSSCVSKPLLHFSYRRIYHQGSRIIFISDSRENIKNY